MNRRPLDLVQAIVDYEEGDQGEEETIEFFRELVRTGLIYHLQGYYQRMAQALFEAGKLP